MTKRSLFKGYKTVSMSLLVDEKLVHIDNPKDPKKS